MVFHLSARPVTFHKDISVVRVVSSGSNTSGEQAGGRYELAVSTYDRVASTLLALLLLVGLVVLVLGVIVYTMKTFTRQQAIPVTLAQVGTTTQPNRGLERDPEPLGAEEAPELAEPQLEKQLTAVSDSVAQWQAELTDPLLEGNPQSSRGRGKGDSREAGRGNEGISERVPRAERWEIRFDGGTLNAYSRQLDFFGIELAVLGEENLVHYASHFSQGGPRKRSSPPELEERLYMTWRGGALQKADRQLLARAGITTQGMVLQFYPPEVEQLLAREELQFAAGKSVELIRKTIFGIQREGESYRFHVLDQKYFDE